MDENTIEISWDTLAQFRVFIVQFFFDTKECSRTKNNLFFFCCFLGVLLRVSTVRPVSLSVHVTNPLVGVFWRKGGDEAGRGGARGVGWRPVGSEGDGGAGGGGAYKWLRFGGLFPPAGLQFSFGRRRRDGGLIGTGAGGGGGGASRVPGPCGRVPLRARTVPGRAGWSPPRRPTICRSRLPESVSVL